MSAYERRRGANGELELVRLLKDLGYPHARRTQDGRPQERGDIAGGPAGLVIECKRTQRLRIREAWKQANDAATEWEIPVIATRWDRGPWLGIMDLAELIALAQLREGGLR